MKMSGISSECVKRTVADLNGEKELAFVMVTGDLLQDGEVENAQEIKKYLDQLTVPYYVLSGNHDYIPADPKKRREGFTYMTSEEFVAASQFGCPWPQFNRPWKSHNKWQRKMPPAAGFAIGGVIGVIY